MYGLVNYIYLGLLRVLSFVKWVKGSSPVPSHEESSCLKNFVAVFYHLYKAGVSLIQLMSETITNITVINSTGVSIVNEGVHIFIYKCQERMISHGYKYLHVPDYLFVHENCDVPDISAPARL